MASEIRLSPASRLPSLPNAPPRFCSKPPKPAASLLFPSSRPALLPVLHRKVVVPVLRWRLGATEQQQGQVQEQQQEVVDSNVLPYCSIDRKKKKTLGEMEQEFLQALQSFYYDQKAIMSNEEFDNLKEELMWEGSSVVMLSPDEQRLLEASMAYAAGKPIMSDAEFDELKLRLKVYSDLTVDYLKMLLLNVPATVVALGLFFFIDELTGFEINVFQGPCPNCGTENLSFFGTILSVSSGGATNNVKCANCSTELVYDSKSRLITLPEPSN
ncbi:PGR5-like protein 1A, chloroplastic [Dichanthelium oligosanthes]|uniref:PGR5-like protein 1A, chloroplastic n=1 Tax=Dichanthelium oligosanthes TaxID=888268 RepID=A0A1E5VK43_9POAL|nr:PGR5-like protein 1A, chloroplastic [Dichanthelium oligosanthes]